MNPDENEWLAQESAMRDARAGSASEPAAARYRAIVDALRVVPASALPLDFAARVAHTVDLQADVDARFERRLVGGLVLAFALGLVVAVASVGEAPLRAFAALVPASSPATFNWLFAALACLAVSWTMGWLSNPAAPARSRGEPV